MASEEIPIVFFPGKSWKKNLGDFPAPVLRDCQYVSVCCLWFVLNTKVLYSPGAVLPWYLHRSWIESWPGGNWGDPFVFFSREILAKKLRGFPGCRQAMILFSRRGGMGGITAFMSQVHFGRTWWRRCWEEKIYFLNISNDMKIFQSNSLMINELIRMC